FRPRRGVQRRADEREIVLEIHELAALLSPAVKDRSRMEGGDHLPAVPSVDPPAHRGDATVRVQHELRREVAEGHDDDGLDDRDRLDQPWRARLDLIGEGIAVARWATSKDVRDVDVLTPQTDPAEHPREQLPGRANERLPLLVFVESRRLPDEQQVGVGVPDPEDDLRAALGQSAARTRRCLGRHLGERSAHAVPSPSSFDPFDPVDARRRRPDRGTDGWSTARANPRSSRTTGSGVSSMGMCPASGITTSRPSGNAAVSATAPAGGVTRSCSPTSTIAGTRTRGTACRRSISMSSGSASVQTSDAVLWARATTWSTTSFGAFGPNCVTRATTPLTPSGLARTARRSPSTRRAAAWREPSRGRSSSVTDPMAPRRRS